MKAAQAFLPGGGTCLKRSSHSVKRKESERPTHFRLFQMHRTLWQSTSSRDDWESIIENPPFSAGFHGFPQVIHNVPFGRICTAIDRKRTQFPAHFDGNSAKSLSIPGL
jgi:hypothetical protein